MPPRRFSRYTFTSAVLDDDDNLLLTEPEPFRFRELADNRVHIAADGDTLFTLAHRFFDGLPRPAGLWWIIADFQPDPILDPTLKLARGRAMFLPSVRTITDEVFSETRRGEATP